MKNTLRMAVLAALVLWAPSLTATSLADLTYLTEDYPPENYVENGVLKGFAVDLLQAVWAKLGVPPQRIEVLPWARAYAQLENQADVVLFATARTPEREAKFQWAGPIYHARISLIGLAGKVPKLANVAEATRYSVAVMNNDVGDQTLRDLGFPTAAVTKVTTHSQLLQMLASGRVDLICTTEPSVQNEMKLNPKLKVATATALVLDENQVFYAFSKKTDPALVRQFQIALTAIDAQRLAIIRRYHLVE